MRLVFNKFKQFLRLHKLILQSTEDGGVRGVPRGFTDKKVLRATVCVKLECSMLHSFCSIRQKVFIKTKAKNSADKAGKKDLYTPLRAWNLFDRFLITVLPRGV